MCNHVLNLSRSYTIYLQLLYNKSAVRSQLLFSNYIVLFEFAFALLYSRMFWFGICYVLGCFQCFHDVIRTRVKYTLKSRWQLKWENWRSLILKDRCLFHLLLKQYAIKWCFIFSPHLASASALPGKTGNQEIASFHFNPQPADTQNTFKLSLGRMWITLCLQNNRTKQDLGWEHSMLSSVATHSSFIMSVMIQ